MALSSSAAVLVRYELPGSYTPTTVDPNVTATDVGQVGLPNISSPITTQVLRIPANNINNATPTSSTDYIWFTVTPDNPLTLDLTSLTFRADRLTNPVGGTYPARFSVFSSVDSYTTSLTGNVELTGTMTGYTVDLSAPAYQGLSSVTFRIAFGDDSDASGSRVRIDNLILNGTVVPKPHEYAALAGLCLLGFAVCAAPAAPRRQFNLRFRPPGLLRRSGFLFPFPAPLSARRTWAHGSAYVRARGGLRVVGGSGLPRCRLASAVFPGPAAGGIFPPC